MSDAYPAPGLRALITASVMAASMMNTLDSTIANVALPHMQGSLSASSDQIAWVLTSYIVVAAIMTPLAGWLAGRFGRKRLIAWSIIGFTAASGLCGLSTSLSELILFRILQGAFGAALIPMSQAVLLDINPPERHGQAMSIWGMGAVLGPIIGPALGGYLTDYYDWRWVFYINVPVGVLSLAGVFVFLGESKADEHSRFDVMGFAMLSLGIASLQMMLDRGQQQDWFSAWEIRIEAALAIAFLYMFVVHTLTARRPYIDLALFRDRNFVSSTIVGFFLGVMVFSVLSLLPPLLEKLMGYPVVTTGLVTAPRGVGTMVAMLTAGQLIRRIDARVLVGAGLLLAGYGTYMMSGFSLQMDESLIISSGFIQGFGTGLMFVPLSTMAFVSLDPRLRNEGAAMFTLIRNLGSAMGISVLQVMTIRNSEIAHSRLAEQIRPDNPAIIRNLPDFDFGSTEALARMNEVVTQQAMMVSYVHAFHFLFLASLIVMPLILLMKPSKDGGKAPAVHMD